MARSSDQTLMLLHSIIDKRADFFPYLSEPGKNLMNAGWKTGYEEFADKNPDLASLPSETIMAIKKQLFSLFVETGYFLWMAEQLLDKKAIGKSTVTSTEQLDELTGQPAEAGRYELSDTTAQALIDFCQEVLNNFAMSYPAFKFAPNELQKGLEKALLNAAAMAYQVACAEAPYRL